MFHLESLEGRKLPADDAGFVRWLFIVYLMFFMH